MKCIPRTFAGRLVAEAIRVMGMAEVFAAKIVRPGQTESIR
jgi:hypothetical protein